MDDVNGHKMPACCPHDIPGLQAHSTVAKLLPAYSPLWERLHYDSKLAIRDFVLKQAAKHYKPIYEKKIKEGWINPEIGLIHDIFGEIIDKEEIVWLRQDAQNADQILLNDDITINRNRELWHSIRMIVCCLFDEDSYYMLRMLFLLDALFRNQDKFRMEMHKSRAYWNWDEIKQKIEMLEDVRRLRREGWQVPEVSRDEV